MWLVLKGCGEGVIFRTDVPAFCGEDADAEDEEEHACACPSVGEEGSGFVEVGLVDLETS